MYYSRIINIYLILLVLQCCVYEASSCDGYEFNVRKVRNCGLKNVVQVKRKISLHLDEKCNIIPKGCLKIMKTFSEFTARFSATQNGFVFFNDTFDGCQLLESEGMIHCPIQAGEMCINGEIKVSIAAFRDFLPLVAGEFLLEMEAQHNSGKTCFRMEGLLYHKNIKSKPQ